MIFDIDKKNRTKEAIVDDQAHRLTYGDLTDRITRFAKKLESRTIVFILCENCSESLIGYLSFIDHDIVPLLLSRDINNDALDNLIRTYEPKYLFIPKNYSISGSFSVVFTLNNYTLLESEYQKYPIHDQLQLLMSTSGSTGSPKIVRYKKGNLDANAKNVAISFGWTENERAICNLGMQYTMGLNVINTHLYVGATVLLTTHNIVSGNFWDFIKTENGSNFTGVPFSYDILHRLKYQNMDIDCIRTFCQGGGKLTNDLFSEYAEYCANTDRRFIASFGTTETAARISMLDPTFATVKIGSIGKAIVDGEMFLIDESGRIIEGSETTGELCYKGPNVTMGYAENRQDLNEGDTWTGEYHTGDLAYRDNDGFYYISGRKNRFLKLLSHRIGLDECEKMITEEFSVECSCAGNDQKMHIYIVGDVDHKSIIAYICQKLCLFKGLFEVHTIDAIPRSKEGKVDYKRLETISTDEYQ